MDVSKLREKDLVQAEDGPETDLGLSEEIAQEDFEHVEDSLWEEYLQEDMGDSGMTPERSLIKMRMEQATTVLTAFVIFNMFYIIIMFVAWYIPAGALYGAAIFEGALVMTFVGGGLSIAWYDENHGMVQGILAYFPVNAGRLRREMYMVVGKYMGVQVLITCIPMLIMGFGFVPERFFLTIICTVVSMLVVACLFVEGSMHLMKARK